jgi:hypothetical protein
MALPCRSVLRPPTHPPVASPMDLPSCRAASRWRRALPPRPAGKPVFSMLGLGDVVIPGIFVALMLRYDHKHGSKLGWSAFVGYVAGLATTIVVMNVFKAAQPALLYIVPAVLGAVGLHALATGQLVALWRWSEAAEGGARADGAGAATDPAAEAAAGAPARGEGADRTATALPAGMAEVKKDA